jgi:uncharacterized protein YndB with AHSA1/START domain/predicted enzyme related to lactoylglutathione lyase
MKTIIISWALTLVSYQAFNQKKMESTSKEIVKSRVFNQSIDSVWWRWTTHEGLKTFFGLDNKIDLTPNGDFEIYFLLDNPPGLRGSETCKVLSFLPKRYLSFTWNAPPPFESVRNSEYKTWVVVEFTSINNSQTEILLTHTGWVENEEWNKVFDYFDKAWDVVLNGLSKFDLVDTDLKQVKKVTGIGGVFFKCKDPDKLKQWYKTHLGLNTDQWGTNFEWRKATSPTKKGFTQWSPFSEKSKHFDGSYMINYRVENLEALVEQLRKDGVTIVDNIEAVEYGKFVHIIDVEGNKVELWEPNDIEYEKIVEGRTN